MAYKNKIVFDGETLIDLTGDTITPNDLRVGVTAHDMSGAPITGTMEGGTTGGTVITDLPYQDGELYFTGDELTPTWANYDPEIMEIWGEKSATGSGDYEVTFYLADGYVWPDGSNAYKTTWTITQIGSLIFGENTPEEIQQVVSHGLASTYWAIGDTIAITLNGTAGTCEFNDETYYAFILGFDHNAGLETDGKYSLTLQFGKTADGIDIAFRDPNYDGGTSSTATGFRMNSTNTNVGGWASCWMRNTVCSSFLEVLPAEWQSVIGAVTKYQDNVGGSSNTAANISTTGDQIFLLAEYEVSGARTYANNYEQNYQQQYNYYAVGNAVTKYKNIDVTTTSAWWSRSPCCSNSTGFCYINSSSSPNQTTAYSSSGFAPAFCIIDNTVTITDLPYQDGVLYHDGSELTPTWANYDPDIMTISGETSAIEAGTYTAVFTLADGYVWPDGSRTLEVKWTIKNNYIAFYSADDDSLNFCHVDTIPDVGSTLLNKTVTTVYNDVDSTGTSSSSVPWYSDAANFKSVVFDESFADVKPAQTAYWFSGFSNCTSITGLEYLNTSSVTNMTYMFYGCSSLTSLDVSNFSTSKVTNMSYMFHSCAKLTSLSLSNFDTSSVTTMADMFHYCSGLTSLSLSNFDTSKVTTMSWMFGYCQGLTSLSVSNFNTSSVTTMADMFYYCSGLTSLSLSNFDTSKVTTMSWMFGYCQGLTSLSVSNFNTSSVTTMASMFYYCSGLTSLSLSNFDTSKVTTMSWMFGHCRGLTSLSVSNFNTSNVTDMSDMFYYCSALTTIYSNDSNFVTTNVTSDGSMFSSCSKLVGGNGTKYSSSKVDSSMAHIDTSSNPGYFTKG